VTRKVCVACSREFTGVVTACPHDGTVLIPLVADQLVGTKLADRYQVLSVIGHGGMGVVYKARHELMDRLVAIKMLKADLISDSVSVKRFQQEARAASLLKHRNVATLFDFGVSPSGQPYLVMEYLEGISLADVIKKDGHVGVDRTVKIFTQAAAALEHAHHQKVIHRDLKPGNIMLIETDEEKEFVKVVDFGVAKVMTAGADEEAQRLTQIGEVCGSPVYMSPEQCMGQRLDPRSDIYSMGVVMYESLTGKLPLLGKTMVDTMSKHISERPPAFSKVRPDLYIPERLEAVVFKTLEKDPAHRPQSMADLERELEWAVPKPGKSAALRNTIQPTGTDIKAIGKPAFAGPRRPVGVFVGVVVALLAASGIGLAWLLHQKPDRPGKPEPRQATVTPPLPGTIGGEQRRVETKPAPALKPSASQPRQPAPQIGSSETRPARHASKPTLPARAGVRAARRPAGAQEDKSESGAGQDKMHTVKVKPADPFAQLERSRSYTPD